MSISRRKFVVGVAAGTYTLASGFPAPALVKNTPLRIGILAPRSGAAGTIGECGLRGALWAAGRVNKAGGIAGRQVELVIDEELSGKETIERFRLPVEQEKVDCVQGIVSTGTSLAVAPVAEAAKKLLILWDGTTQNGVKDTMPEAQYVFKSTDNECEAVMGSLLAVKYYKGKFHRIAGMNPDYSYGRNNWEAFKQILTRYGVEFKVVAERWPKVGSSASDLAPHVEALKAAKPDLIFSSMLFADLPVFLTLAHATHVMDRVKYVLPAAPGRSTRSRKKSCPKEASSAGTRSISPMPKRRNCKRISSPIISHATRKRRIGRPTAPISRFPLTRQAWRQPIRQRADGLTPKRLSPPYRGAKSRGWADLGASARTRSPSRFSTRAFRRTRTSTTFRRYRRSTCSHPATCKNPQATISGIGSKRRPCRFSG